MSGKIYSDGEPYVYQLTLKSLLDKPLVNSPDREIIYRDQASFTYRALNERIHRLANALSQSGVGAGDTVAVFDFDSHRYLECFFGIPMMGAVLQTVNWRLSPDQVVYTVNHAEARSILIHQAFLPILESIWDRLEGIQTLIVMSEEGQAPDSKLPVAGEYDALLASAATAYDFPDLDENTKATTFYTTGTTGNPKGVYFSHRQLTLHTLSTAVELGCYNTIGRLRSDDVYMPLTPMFHVHAWGIPYVATLLGAKQVYPGMYEPAMILKLIKEQHVTFSHCVPTILQMVLAHPDAKETDLSNWKIIIGGARLPKGLAKAARDVGIDIYAGYGMSETCPVMTLATPKEDMLDPGEGQFLDTIIKTGKPIPLVEIEVVDQEGNILPHDGVSTGEVVMRSPWLTAGYFKAPDKSAELWQNGWLYSGDVGYIDAENYLQITDRIKDVIKSGGEWISSLDLENILSQHEAVLESAAIGVPDEKWGERPLMIVTLKPEYRGKVTAEELKQYMAEASAQGKLPRYGIPDRFKFVEEIAKTSVGKLDKKFLRKDFTA
jgi:acyl-CoA synthetase (AMP-forming)/AMP-acid ligase II